MRLSKRLRRPITLSMPLEDGTGLHRTGVMSKFRGAIDQRQTKSRERVALIKFVQLLRKQRYTLFAMQDELEQVVVDVLGKSN